MFDRRDQPAAVRLEPPQARISPIDSDRVSVARPEVHIKRTHGAVGPDGTISVVVEVVAPHVDVARQPVDLALVFDRSGSMGEQDKLVHTLRAARLLIENLTPRDTVSIIAFNETVRVLEAQQAPTRKRFLGHWFRELEAEGETNLSGGLLAGYAELARSRRPEAVARVLLMTDGLANRGVTDSRQLVRIADHWRGREIGLSTFGVGEAFDELVLGALAHAGGGRYEYIARAEEIPAVIGREIGGVLPPVLQNVTVRAELPDGLTVASALPADPRPVPGLDADDQPRQATVRLGDFLPGERKMAVIELALPSGAADALADGDELVQIATVTVEGTPALGDAVASEPLTFSEVVRARISTDRVEAERSVFPAVYATARAAQVLELTYAALKARDRALCKRACDEIKQVGRLTRVIEASTDLALQERFELLRQVGRELHSLWSRGLIEPGRGAAGDHEYDCLLKDVHFRRYRFYRHRGGAASEHR